MCYGNINKSVIILCWECCNTMAPVYVGILSVIPPVLSILLALISKEVVASLLIGIISGSAIYSMFTGGGILYTIKVMFITMAKSVGSNVFIIVFISILGALVYVVTMAGGSQAYGRLAAKKIKSRVVVQIATAVLGMLISIDDYFNCLTVGTVMRPITDKHRVSRAKFAYIIDSMAAPVCVIAPISSWAASIVSCIDSADLNGMTIFMQTIPYNFYAILTIVFVFINSLMSFDYGPMAIFEKNAIEKGDLFTTEAEACGKDINDLKVSPKGSALDLLLPILTLMVVAICVMLETGGYFDGGISIGQAFGATDSGLSITVGALAALTVAFIMFIPRKLLTFNEFMEGINKGVKSMVPAFMILSLAWTMSDICGDLICTGDYISDVVAYSNIDLNFIPLIVFVLAGFLSFSMGTSWGTFGILIPVVAAVCSKVDPGMTVIALSATLSGAVFGDHCSPISDTMILSSTGAGCNHMDHVSTQMPYACIVASASAVGFIIAGITRNLALSLSVSLVVMIVCVFVAYKKFGVSINKSRVMSDADAL